MRTHALNFLGLSTKTHEENRILCPPYNLPTFLLHTYSTPMAGTGGEKLKAEEEENNQSAYSGEMTGMYQSLFL